MEIIGILKRAGDAKERTERTQIIEIAQTDILGKQAENKGTLSESELEEILTSNSYNTKGTLSDNEEESILEKTLTSNDGKYTILVSEIYNGTFTNLKNQPNVVALSETETAIFEDDLGNTIKVPKGFGIAIDSGTKVEEGIVIEDADSTRTTYGSQFVWIPVGTGIKVSSSIDESGEIDISLRRYVFNSDGSINTGLSKANPSDILKKKSGTTNEAFTEGLVNSTTINAHAKNILEFINSANNNGGYYIARYEAGINANIDQYSYASCTGSSTSLTYGDSSRMFSKDGSVKPLSIKGKGVWNAVTQSEAAIISQNMYNTTNDIIISDLTNSYAWDTAILYIQKCGQKSNSARYSKSYGKSTTNNISATGLSILKSTNEEDSQCKIYDMCGNVREWNTETDKWSNNPTWGCVGRGGLYKSNQETDVRAGNFLVDSSNEWMGFREILYF